jgi:hypothetical protein
VSTGSRREMGGFATIGWMGSGNAQATLNFAGLDDLRFACQMLCRSMKSERRRSKSGSSCAWMQSQVSAPLSPSNQRAPVMGLDQGKKDRVSCSVNRNAGEN